MNIFIISLLFTISSGAERPFPIPSLREADNMGELTLSRVIGISIFFVPCV